MQTAAPDLRPIAPFYDQEDFLCRVVADFLEPGLEGGVPIVVIATGPHRRGFVEALEARGHDISLAQAAGLLTLLDARDCLAKLMVDGLPDRQQFLTHVGAVVKAAATRSPTGAVRAYGEMVDLLWRDDNGKAAVELEKLWNELGNQHAFTLLCAYGLTAVGPDARQHDFRESSSPPTRGASSQGGATGEQLRAEVAELKANLRELQARHDEVTKNQQATDQLLNVLGHDLRNPLSAIMTAAGLMRRRTDSEQVLKPTERILASTEKMARMIDQLLDFSRLRMGKGLTVDPADCDLGELCRKVIERAAPGRVQLEVRGDATGTWDADRVAQVLKVLLSNALTHGTADAPVAVTVDGSDPAQVAVSVHNHGAMPAELLPVVFEPRERKREGTSGLGLGLNISQQVARAHGGRLEVQSAEPEGTRFTLKLPRKT